MKNNSIKWVWSGGGPLVCIPDSNVHKWGGSLTRTIAKGTDISKLKLPSDCMNPEETHYGEICEKADVIAHLLIDDFSTIIFEEPLNTAWISMSDNESVFVRCFCSDDDDSVTKIKDHINDLKWKKEFEIEIKEETWWLFDSAAILKHVKENRYGDGDNFQKISFKQGKYTVFSAEYGLTDHESFDVYRFLKL